MTVSSNVATDSIETKGRGGRKKISVNRKPLTLKDREDLLLAATLDLYSGKKTQGQVLKWLRVELLSLSQDQYAKMVGVSRKALSDIESDKGKNGVELINRVFSGVGFRIALMPKDSVVLKMAVEAIQKLRSRTPQSDDCLGADASQELDRQAHALIDMVNPV